VLGAGGSVLAAVLAAILVGGRFLAMGVAIGPSLRGGPVRRALEGRRSSTPPSCWRGRGRRGSARGGCSRHGPQFAAWVLGTLLGVLAGARIGDPERFGLDVVFPAFFLVLLASELREPGTRAATAAGALIALALIPFTPPGVPVIAACAAVLVGRAKP
jgi:predicted branched-subunit amino acid permease